MLQVLASWSPVFMAMFSNSFVEKEQGKVVMHGKSVDDVRLLLNCIYPPNSHTVNSGYRACNVHRYQHTKHLKPNTSTVNLTIV